MYTFRYHRMQFENDADVLIAEVKRIFEQGDYVAVFGWLQWVLRKRDCPYNLLRQIDAALHRAGRHIVYSRKGPSYQSGQMQNWKRSNVRLPIWR